MRKKHKVIKAIIIAEMILFLSLVVGTIIVANSEFSYESKHRPLPYGVWQSDDTNIVLDIKPVYITNSNNEIVLDQMMTGTYKKDGIEYSLIFQAFLNHTGYLSMYAEDNGIPIFSFTGSLGIKGSQMFSISNDTNSNLTNGYTEIVFKKIQSYD